MKMYCAWCHGHIRLSQIFAKVNDQDRRRYICSPECMVKYGAIMLGWSGMEEVAREILDAVESHKKAGTKELDDLPF